MEAFLKLKKIRIIGNIFIFLGLIMLCLVLVVAEFLQPFFAISGTASAVIGLLIFVFFWKCPVCYYNLPLEGSFGMEKCPHCGNNLFD